MSKIIITVLSISVLVMTAVGSFKMGKAVRLPETEIQIVNSVTGEQCKASKVQLIDRGWLKKYPKSCLITLEVNYEPN